MLCSPIRHGLVKTAAQLPDVWFCAGEALDVLLAELAADRFCAAIVQELFGCRRRISLGSAPGAQASDNALPQYSLGRRVRCAALRQTCSSCNISSRYWFLSPLITGLPRDATLNALTVPPRIFLTTALHDECNRAAPRKRMTLVHHKLCAFTLWDLMWSTGTTSRWTASSTRVIVTAPWSA